MSKRFLFFVVVLILSLNGEIFSQSIIPHIKEPLKLNLSGSQYFNYYSTVASVYKPFYHTPSSKTSILTKMGQFTGQKNFLLNSSIAGDFYQKSLGFMCQKEWQMEKHTKVPLRFRLGSLAYTDYLEGKSNSSRPR